AAPAPTVAAPPPAPELPPAPVRAPVAEAQAVAPAPREAEPAVVPSPREPVAVVREPAAEAPTATDTAALARQLFPAAETPATGSAVADLYPRLFPTGAPQNLPEEAPVIERVEPGQQAGLPVGPFRVRAAVDARYVDADTFVEASAVATRDRYMEVQPRVEAVTPVGEGQFAVDYAPVFRAFATYDQVNSSSHDLGARLSLQAGPRVTLRARDRFRSGVLDNRVVDPGGEYFFGLGRFHRNDADLGASIMVGPRLSLELGGAIGAVRFQEESTFFDYDTRRAEAGLGYEITPSLKAVATYAYDAVPRPDERPEAESTAHSALLTLSGEITPLLSGDVTVGYRSQDSPGAGAGGTGYSGLTLSAALSRQIGRESNVAVYASRSTPLSAYEQNAFYVSTALQGTVRLPLLARFELRGGLGYQWNDYRTVASAIGRPREDEILGWYVGLRRPLWENVFLSGAYRSEDRKSNVSEFETDADGFYFQLEWDIFGSPSR
ncbi:MAG TPA: outer membrane beta-barrel protein, partial [Vicinamibacteria bacterium]